MNLVEEFFELRDLNYKNFSSKLTKTKYEIIGVRIPTIKNIAKRLKDTSINFYNSIYFEEIMLEGLLIGYLKDIDIVIEKLKRFIPKIDDWSVCDSCCANLKITKKNKNKIWDFINKYSNSNNEFEVRFMVVMMMDYYLEKEYINDIFNVLDNIRCDGYYANMAISWLLATALAKFETETLKYLQECNLSNFIFNKTINKACESYRVRGSLKAGLKQMKR